ncbi:hypothetical protein [Pyrobaculum aerophilum]|uniref:hypothetical protein n=1 Tax=Pyrobaculum aerophilum TaxID=13773 RepID=UPI002FDA3438
MPLMPILLRKYLARRLQGEKGGVVGLKARAVAKALGMPERQVASLLRMLCIELGCEKRSKTYLFSKEALKKWLNP